MNIKPPGSSPPGSRPGIDPGADAGGIGDVGKAAGADRKKGVKESFAEKLQGTQATTQPDANAAAAATDRTGGAQPIAEQLERGEITAEQATSRLIDEALDSIPSSMLSDDERINLKEMLEGLAQSDPTLQSLARGLRRP